MSVKAAAAKSKTSRAKSSVAKTATKKVATKKSAEAASLTRRKKSRSGASSTKVSDEKKPAATPPAIAPAELSHRLHLLLHSIHQIERYEERLCSITDAIKRTGRLNASLRNDLQTLIEELPSDEFLHDLDAVRSAILP